MGDGLSAKMKSIGDKATRFGVLDVASSRKQASRLHVSSLDALLRGEQ
jgi:hypothetical protein